MKPLEVENIIKMHVDKFGFEPKITGINFHISDQILDLILQAIEDNIPYVEQEVPKDVDI
jgi:hypothetical protein